MVTFYCPLEAMMLFPLNITVDFVEIFQMFEFRYVPNSVSLALTKRRVKA